MRTTPSPARSQRELRRQINRLEALQALRRAVVVEQKQLLDEMLEEKQREIDNLRAGQTPLGIAR